MAQAAELYRTREVDCRPTEQPPELNAVVRHLSHELRQPLSTIDTAAYYLQLILSGADPRADQQLERIQQMVHQMSWILSDGVHFLQAAAPRPAWIDLCEMITDHLTAQAVEQNVELDWTDCCSTPLVLMDPGQGQHLVRTVLNLFRQVARTEEPVYVSLYRDGTLATLECSCEAGEALLAHASELFEPFTPHLPPGSGLALASVKRIAEAHSGSASIEGADGVLKLEVRLPAE
jgi:signal transduction histidine kinase